MIQAKGNGQSECIQCKKEGKFSLTWTSFYLKYQMIIIQIAIVIIVLKN